MVFALLFGGVEFRYCKRECQNDFSGMLLHRSYTFLNFRFVRYPENPQRNGPLAGELEKKQGKQACLQLSVVWLIVELAERRTAYAVDQRCAEAILFRLDKPSLFLQ